MRKLTLFFILSFKLAALYAQQDPIYAQYLLNPIVVNPAYAGINNDLTLGATYRNQWVAMEGKPQTMLVNGNMSLMENHLGVGATVSQDKTGVTTNTEFNAIFSYKVNLAEDKVLSFGLQGGAMQFRNNYSSLTPYNVDDPAFTGTSNFSRLNLGAGVFFKSRHLIAGVSVPRMLPSNVKSVVAGQNFDLYNQHVYVFSAYLWQLNERILFKPSVLFRGVKAAPASFDVALNLNVDRKYTAGLFTRNLNTYGLLVQALFLDKLVLGYTFEVPSGKSVETIYTSHEVSLGLRLSVLKSHQQPDGLF